MSELEDVLAAEQRLHDYLEKARSGGPYPGFNQDLEYLLARINLLRAQNARLKVKAKEA